MELLAVRYQRCYDCDCIIIYHLCREFASKYHKYIIRRVKAKNPHIPLILFVHKGVGAHLPEMVASGADIINVDW